MGQGVTAGLDSGGFQSLGKPPLTFSKPWKIFGLVFQGLEKVGAEMDGMHEMDAMDMRGFARIAKPASCILR